MNIIPSSYAETHKNTYQEQLDYIRERSAEVWNGLLNVDISNKIKAPKEDLVYFILALHEYLMFSKSPELENKLKQFGLKPIQSRWFISLDELIEQFDRVESYGIKVNKLIVILYVNLHLKFKFCDEIQYWANQNVVKDDVRKTNFSIYLKNLKTRRNAFNGKSPQRIKNLGELEINERINWAIDESDGLLNLDMIIDFFKGKTDRNMIRPMIDTAFEYDKSKLSQRKFRIIIYDLLQLFMQDKLLDYRNAKEIKKNKDPNAKDKIYRISKYLY